MEGYNQNKYNPNLYIQKIRIYDDSDETYHEMLKRNNFKQDKKEIIELDIEKLHKENEELRNEIECINEGYNKLIEILKKKNLI